MQKSFWSPKLAKKFCCKLAAQQRSIKPPKRIQRGSNCLHEHEHDRKPKNSLPSGSLEGGVTPPGAPGLSGHGLLREEARGGNHRQAAVGEFLLLHEGKLLRVLGREAERVEGEISRLVAIAERGLSLASVVERRPALADARELSRADADGQNEPQPRRQLRDLLNGRPTVTREERVELLLDDKAERGEHGHAAVRQLGLAVPVYLGLGLALGETSRVKLSQNVLAAG
eukprot:scaffold407_cov130-Isochrysis_galbana.AAC.6